VSSILEGLTRLGELQREDRAIDGEALPWVPQAEGVWFKPLRFDLNTGRWINLIRMSGKGTVNRHRHTGGQVMGYVLQGSWRYLERDWVAKPGTLVWEPPGDVHTLVLEGEEDMVTLFILEGTVQYLDDQDGLLYQDDVFSKLEKYLDWCEQEGVRPADLTF